MPDHISTQFAVSGSDVESAVVHSREREQEAHCRGSIRTTSYVWTAAVDQRSASRRSIMPDLGAMFDSVPDGALSRVAELGPCRNLATENGTGSDREKRRHEWATDMD